MHISPRLALILCSLAFALTTPCAHATTGQPGTLDTAWNGSGKVITPIGNGNDVANAMTLQPDGKVLVAGYCYNGTNNDFCAARYLSNGTLDTTWNGTGKVITPIGSGDDNATAMALQPDGKVLVAGSCVGATNADFCAARFLDSVVTRFKSKA